MQELWIKIRYKHGQKVLYVKVLREIYGCIESPLLWYNIYASTLKGLGSKINPYEMSVSNKMIDGKQYTLL